MGIVRWIPCHSPMKTRLTRSFTRVEPSSVMRMVSWKSAIRQLWEKTGVLKANRQTRSSRFRLASHILELHRYRLAVRCGHLEKLFLLEAEHSGENVRRKRLYFRIQIANDCVVVAPRILNGIFGLAERTLQLGELLRRFELRIVFGHGE